MKRIDDTINERLKSPEKQQQGLHD